MISFKSQQPAINIYSHDSLQIHDSIPLNRIKQIDISTKKRQLPKRTITPPVIGSDIYCHQLLVALIKSSSIDPKIKKFKIKVWVEEVKDGIAKLEVTIRNTERHDDVPISWVEMDFNKKELRDITVDIDKPVLLKYDSTLFRKIDKECRVK